MKPMSIAFALAMAGLVVTGALAASASIPLAAFSATRSIDTEREMVQSDKTPRASASALSYYAVQSR